MRKDLQDKKEDSLITPEDSVTVKLKKNNLKNTGIFLAKDIRINPPDNIKHHQICKSRLTTRPEKV